MADNTLLWQVELLPPSAANLRTVKQAIDQTTASQERFNKSQSQSKSSTAAQASVVQDFKNKLNALRIEMDKTEQAARFGNANREKAIQTLQTQGVGVEQLRSQIESLNVSEKQRLQLMQMVQARAKQSQLAQTRLKSNFVGISQTAGNANATLMSLGRILSDLPYGFIGISNNLEQSTMQMSFLNQKTGGLRGSLGALSKSIMSPAGLLILAGSAIPAALSLSVIGFRNWGSSAKEAAGELAKLEDQAEDLVPQLEKFFMVSGGTDILDMRKLHAQTESIEQLRTTYGDLIDIQNKLRSSGQDEFGIPTQEGTQTLRDYMDLTNQLHDGLETTDMTYDGLVSLTEQHNELLDEQEKKMNLIELNPMLDSLFKNWGKAVEGVQAYNLGLLGIEETEDGYKNTLEITRDAQKETVDALTARSRAGEEDLIPQLKEEQKILEHINDALSKRPDKPVIEIEEPDTEVFLDSVEKSVNALTDDGKWKAEKVWGTPEQVAEFAQKMADKEFDVRKDMVGDLAQEVNNFYQMTGEIERIAQEKGMENHESVESLKTAISEKYAYRRYELEKQLDEELKEAKMQTVQETQEFLGAAQKLMGDQNQIFALAQLAVQKGLKIAEVATEANARAFELRSQARTARGQSAIAAAKGNFVQAAALNTAALTADAQAARIKASAAKTIGVIAATGLLEAVSIAVGSGGGGSSSSSRSSRSNAKTGFFTSKEEDEENERRPYRIPDRMRNFQGGANIYVVVDNKVDEKGIATLVRRGERRLRNKRIHPTVIEP